MKGKICKNCKDYNPKEGLVGCFGRCDNFHFYGYEKPQKGSEKATVFIVSKISHWENDLEIHVHENFGCIHWEENGWKKESRRQPID